MFEFRQRNRLRIPQTCRTKLPYSSLPFFLKSKGTIKYCSLHDRSANSDSIRALLAARPVQGRANVKFCVWSTMAEDSIINFRVRSSAILICMFRSNSVDFQNVADHDQLPTIRALFPIYRSLISAKHLCTPVRQLPPSHRWPLKN